MGRHIKDEELLENELSKQIPEAETNLNDSFEDNDEPNEVPNTAKTQDFLVDSLGTLKNVPGKSHSTKSLKDSKEENSKIGLGTIGDNIFSKAEYRDGWIDVDRSLLGERDIFYPEDWQFKIRPANVEAIKNWSTLDEENFNSIDDVFNEILKSCLSINTSTGQIPWGNINSWDRFFFILLIREYTFIKGESKLEYEEECVECENSITFTLTSSALMYDMPDKEIIDMYDKESRCWRIDPTEYDIDGDPITFYLPTLEKDANIKAWVISKLQENKNKKIDQVFIKFLAWLAPKISKDPTIADRQIRGYQNKFKDLDTEMFSFMDDVIRNITVTPSTKLITKCPVCGEEVTSTIRFQNSIRDLFTVRNKYKKFGSK